MKHTYNFKLVCRCPNDKTVNIYDVEIKSNEIEQVEEFGKIQRRIYNDFMFQEDLFEILKSRFEFVKLTSFHLGVKVISQ
tara:strand:- start:153 stop:392 length:240 start_codon:yes stop_codon:yes gene_type:complete